LINCCRPVVRAAADGYTLLPVCAAFAINATLYEKLNFNVTCDITPVRGHQPRAPRHGGESIRSGEDGFRIHRLTDYYGLLASGKRADNIARARELLTLPIIPIDAVKAANANADQPQTPEHRCPCCGGRMIIIERFERGSTPRYQPSPPTPVIRVDTS
jgi:hypothetical protein